jgi:hypothetical protein
MRHYRGAKQLCLLLLVLASVVASGLMAVDAQAARGRSAHDQQQTDSPRAAATTTIIDDQTKGKANSAQSVDLGTTVKDEELTMLTFITAPITTFDAKTIIASIDHFIQRGFTGERAESKQRIRNT